MQTTGTTYIVNQGPRKEAGWCEKEGVDHAWVEGATLTSSPPIQTRICVNCGKRQWKNEPQWYDA